MRVTKEIREYIRKQIIAKAQPKLDAVNNDIKIEEDLISSKIDSVEKFLEGCVEKLKEDVVEFAKSRGLTVRDALNFRLHVGCSDFVETYYDYCSNKPKYGNNKKYCKLWKDRRNLLEKINNSVTEIVFKLEAGAKRGEIEEMLAAIKF